MNQTSAANIGILFSLASRDQSARSYGAKKREWIHGYAGTCNALTFGHVPYKVVIEADLKAETLKGLGSRCYIPPGEKDKPFPFFFLPFPSGDEMFSSRRDVSH